MKKFLKRFKAYSGKFIGLGVAYDSTEIGLCLPWVLLVFVYRRK
jgi:hypothetical protein